MAHPDLRHRLVLHNIDLGPALAQRAFAERPEAGDIARRHVREDMRGEPTLGDWLAVCDLDRFPRSSFDGRNLSLESLVELATDDRQLASGEGPRAVLDLLTLPMRLCPDLGTAPLAVLCNAAGPFIIRHILGPPREVASSQGGKTIFDPAWTAEAMIWWLMGRRIPALSELAAAVRNVPN